MNTEAPNNDVPSREYIADTWRWKQDGARWLATLSPATSKDAATVNRWASATVTGLLDDFAPLARVRTATLVADDGPTELSRQADEPYAQFRARLRHAIAVHPLPLMAVVFGLDVRVWARTTEFPDHPELAWISFPGIELWLHLDDEAWVHFSLDNTLFSAFTFPDEDPNPLYPLNQPLLEAALRRLRARATGPLDRTGELPGTYEFGFSSDRDDY